MTVRPPGPAGSPRDRGSIVIALLLVMVTTSMTALLLPLAVTRAGSARREVDRTRELDAAMAGIESAVGQIRAAVDVDGTTGKLSALPTCDSTLTGNVGNGSARYQVTVYYLALDPVGQTEQWARTNAMCSSGKPASTPVYALLLALGTDQSTGAFAADPQRTLRATYTFHTTSQPAPGGLIHGLQGSAFAPDLCLDAGSGPWAAGQVIAMRLCVPGATRQTFAYDRDLSLHLVASKTVAVPLGLCLDGGSLHAVGNPVTLQNCQATTPSRQRWSFNGNANFDGTTNGTTTDGYCFNVQFPDTQGSPVVLGSATNSACDTVVDSQESFSPDTRVGAGMANPPNTTGQFVDLLQFGRCLDIPGGRVSYGYLIAWPCKQSPDGVNPGWNQVWGTPALTGGAAVCGATEVPCGKGTISVVVPTGKATPAGTYCVGSPGSTAAGQYVDAKTKCPAGAPPANLTWTVYGDTHDPLTRYHIVDSTGLCLIPSLTDLFTSGVNVGKTVLQPCADSALQMWNAPADANDPTPLKDVYEP